MKIFLKTCETKSIQIRFSDNVDNDIQSLCSPNKQRITGILIREEKKNKNKDQHGTFLKYPDRKKRKN